MKRMLILGLALLFSLVGTSTVHAAGKPIRLYAPLPPGITAPCAANVKVPFDVAVGVLRNNEYTITFTDASGNPIRQIIQGALSITLTNMANGHSIDINLSGPSYITFNSDGSFVDRYEGLSGIPIDGQILLTRGAVVVEYFRDGSATILSSAGQQTDACTLLA